MAWIPVTKEQFDAFVKTYPRPLKSDISGICEPPQRTLYDFSGKNANCSNSYVACEVRNWLGPDGEIDSTNHGRFWTWAIQADPQRRGIASRIAATCNQIGLNLNTTPAPQPAEALAARPLLEQVARMGDHVHEGLLGKARFLCIGAHTVGEITAISDRAAAWLQENPPGQPVAIEPRGCPMPGACACVEPAPQPIPVSERLPGVAHVWFEFAISDADYCTQAGGTAPTYSQALSEGQHYLAQYLQDGPHTLELRRVEVLAHALPHP